MLHHYLRYLQNRVPLLHMMQMNLRTVGLVFEDQYFQHHCVYNSHEKNRQSIPGAEVAVWEANIDHRRDNKVSNNHHQKNNLQNNWDF
jgi:hypothetical protein